MVTLEKIVMENNDAEVDPTKLVLMIVKVFSSCCLSFSRADIWLPNALLKALAQVSSSIKVR